jgi:hypothetical protein
MAGPPKEPGAGGLKESYIEGVLKELQGKSLTKKKLFDFLSDINIKDLYKAPENTLYGTGAPPPVIEVPPEEFRCGACMKTFATKASLQRHQARFTVCTEWIERPQKAAPAKLTTGIHLIIGDLLEKSIGDGGLECKYCKTRFTNKGNHRKHFNTSSVCNRMAYQEFKRLFSEL